MNDGGVSMDNRRGILPFLIASCFLDDGITIRQYQDLEMDKKSIEKDLKNKQKLSKKQRKKLGL
jgi:hypothetical protein